MFHRSTKYYKLYTIYYILVFSFYLHTIIYHCATTTNTTATITKDCIVVPGKVSYGSFSSFLFLFQYYRTNDPWMMTTATQMETRRPATSHPIPLSNASIIPIPIYPIPITIDSPPM